MAVNGIRICPFQLHCKSLPFKINNKKDINHCLLDALAQKVGDHEQEIPQSHTADQPTAP